MDWFAYVDYMSEHIDMDTRSKPNGSKRITKSHNKHYVLIKIDGKWIPEHRYVMEQKIGRALKRHELVHHIDDDSLNNDIENLQIVTAGEHNAIHNPGRYKYKPKVECKYCGEYMPYSIGNIYCSARCKFYATHRTYTCAHCSKRFIAYRSDKRKYCSPQCNRDARRNAKV